MRFEKKRNGSARSAAQDRQLGRFWFGRRRNGQLRAEHLLAVRKINRAITNFDHAQNKRDRRVWRLQSDIIAFGHSFSVDDSEARMTERNRAYADHVGAQLDDDLRRRGSRTGSGEALGPGLNK